MSEPVPPQPAPQKPPEPVVWLYGFVPMTRRRYVFQAVLTFGLAVGIAAVWGFYWPPFREQLAKAAETKVEVQDDPARARVLLVGDYLPYVLGVVAVLVLVEAYVVMGMFSRKEKEAAEAPAPPPEANP